VALERTLLILEAQTRLEQERWIREFGEQLMRLSDLRVVMEQATGSLRELVKADGVTLTLVPPTAEATPLDVGHRYMPRSTVLGIGGARD